MYCCQIRRKSCNTKTFPTTNGKLTRANAIICGVLSVTLRSTRRQCRSKSRVSDVTCPGIQLEICSSTSMCALVTSSGEVSQCVKIREAKARDRSTTICRKQNNSERFLNKKPIAHFVIGNDTHRKKNVAPSPHTGCIQHMETVCERCGWECECSQSNP